MPSWARLHGPDQEVLLEDGRIVRRRGQGWVCNFCGHTVPISFESVT